MEPSNLITTSYLLSNLHCPSCVSHIQDILSALKPAPHLISPSLVSSVVTVKHDKLLPEETIRDALESAGFDICEVARDDRRSGKSHQSHEEIGYLDQLLAKWQGKEQISENQAGEEKQNNRHVENCEACRLGLEKGHEKGSSSENPVAMQKQELELPLVVVESNNLQDTWRASLAIGGMTCAACVTAIS